MNRAKGPLRTAGWIFQMAWRDSRYSRRRLALYMSSIILGVAALVAITSFGESLKLEIDRQAKSLLGADLSVSSRAPFSLEAQELLADLGGERSDQVSFSTMAYFPLVEGTRLVQVRAIRGEFPFYGTLETDPPGAAHAYRRGPAALVDDALMHQFGVEVGDTIRLGEFGFVISGRLLRIPGESANVSTIGPRVFIPLDYLGQTGLIQEGSRVRYSAFFRFEPERNVEALVREHKEQFEYMRLGTDTVEERREDLGRGLGNAYRFMSLVGFVALLLGGIGVSSSIHFYVRQKMGTIAVLRCLGATPRQTVAIYLVQSAVLGLAGAVLGAAGGVAVQAMLPWLVQNFLPLDVGFTVSWVAVAQGLAVGLGVSLLFTLVPLVAIRRLSPLLVLRADFEPPVRHRRDPLVWLLVTMILAAVLGFSLTQTERWTVGVGFFAGLLTAFLVLSLVARLIVVMARRWLPVSWSYVWRQGLANLYRPHNQTITLILVLGLGTFLIVTLYLAQATILRQVESIGGGDNPNLVFFDIQSDQKTGVRETITAAGLPILRDVPIVTMRLESVKGRNVEQLRTDPEYKGDDWPLLREYRSTYRDHLIETESITAGRWQGQGSVEPVPVSLEDDIARELRVGIGDELVFNVQGIPIRTVVGSQRQVEWRRVQPNFFVVFPVGVLEEAPQFHVIVTRTDSRVLSAQLQRALVERFPNVSAIDLSLILEVVDNILDQVTVVIQFMALFSILTGLIVLAGAVTSARYQRMKECVLLRTLGASRSQVLRIMVVEYLLLGTFAAVTGLVLSVIGGWALAYFVFEATFVSPSLSAAVAIAAVVSLTLLVGMLNSRGIFSRPPLEVLRAEG